MAWPTSNPAWVIFNDEFYGSYRKLLAYNIDLFNAASNGAMVLTAGQIQGDFATMAFLQRLTGLVRDRDPASDAAVSQIDFNWDSMSKVKLAKGTPPVNMTEHFWTWIQKSPAEAAAWLANQLVEEDLYNKVQNAVGGLVAALTNLNGSQTVIYDGSAGVASISGLVTAAQLFGDRKSAIGAWIMHSKSHTDILQGAITNATDLFKFGDINVQEDGYGRRFIISDIPALVNLTPTPDQYRVLGLTAGAVILEGNNDMDVNYVKTNGKENITATWQSQWTYNMGIKGMTYDTANGGRAPNLAAVSTATNWDSKISSPKDGPGVMALFQ